MASQSKPRVLLTGGQTLVLEALRDCLESDLDIEGCVTDVARVDEALRSGPDAAVIHLPASRTDGLEPLRRFRAAAPEVRVVVLAEDENPDRAAEAFRIGVDAWVLKSSTTADLAAAVRAALAGRRYLTPVVAHGNVDALPGPADLESHRGQLRPREYQVLQLLAEGLVMREVGAQLGITPRTVAFHKYHMMETLGVRSTAELLQFAAREEMAGRSVEC